MSMRYRLGSHPTRILLVLLLWAVSSRAEVTLQYSPADTTIDPGASGRLSIILNEPLEVRTIDVVVTYDPAIVLSLGGGAGSLYTESGVYTFQGFENDTPGEWHGYAVLMGAGMFVQGPGELFYWNFEGDSVGRSWIETISVSLAATDGSWYEDVTLATTSLIVGDWSGTPPAPASSSLKIHPNPFNPRTVIDIPSGRGQPATLTVRDARGRLVREIWSGVRLGEAQRVEWNGLDGNGGPAASGTYLFVLESVQGPNLVERGCLIR